MKNVMVTGFALCMALALAAAGCSREKKPEGSTGELSKLYAALRQVVTLNKQYRLGKMSKEDYLATKGRLDGTISKEFTEHREAVWKYSLGVLRKMQISETRQDQINKLTPVKRWESANPWPDKLEPLVEMFCMLPLEMTTVVIKPAFTPEEYANIDLAVRPVELIYLDGKHCTTAFQFGNKIVTADFLKKGMRWKPEEIRLYVQNEKPAAGLKDGSSVASPSQKAKK